MSNSEEIEHERNLHMRDYNDSISEMVVENEVAKNIDLGPESLTFHEAFHTSYIMYSMIEEHIMSNPAIFTSPELFAEAAKARDALWELYQTLGSSATVVKE